MDGSEVVHACAVRRFTMESDVKNKRPDCSGLLPMTQRRVHLRFSTGGREKTSAGSENQSGASSLLASTLTSFSEQVDARPSLHRLHDLSERLSDIEPFIAASGVKQKRHRVTVAGPPE